MLKMRFMTSSPIPVKTAAAAEKPLSSPKRFNKGTTSSNRGTISMATGFTFGKSCKSCRGAV